MDTSFRLPRFRGQVPKFVVVKRVVKIVVKRVVELVVRRAVKHARQQESRRTTIVSKETYNSVKRDLQ